MAAIVHSFGEPNVGYASPSPLSELTNNFINNRNCRNERGRPEVKVYDGLFYR